MRERESWRILSICSIENASDIDRISAVLIFPLKGRFQGGAIIEPKNRPIGYSSVNSIIIFQFRRLFYLSQWNMVAFDDSLDLLPVLCDQFI